MITTNLYVMIFFIFLTLYLLYLYYIADSITGCTVYYTIYIYSFIYYTMKSTYTICIIVIYFNRLSSTLYFAAYYTICYIVEIQWLSKVRLMSTWVFLFAAYLSNYRTSWYSWYIVGKSILMASFCISNFAIFGNNTYNIMILLQIELFYKFYIKYYTEHISICC